MLRRLLIDRQHVSLGLVRDLHVAHNARAAGLDRNVLTLVSEDGTQEALAMGYRTWSYTPMAGYPYYSINAINMMRDLKDDFVAAAAYAWTSSSTLEVRIHYVNWISGTTLVFDFDKHEVTMRDTYPNSKPETVHFVVAR